LYDFNLAQRNDSGSIPPDNETKEEAVQQFLFERPTIDKDAPLSLLRKNS